MSLQSFWKEWIYQALRLRFLLNAREDKFLFFRALGTFQLRLCKYYTIYNQVAKELSAKFPA